MKTTTFAIGGMHCAACAARNERNLLKLTGVHSAAVNFATRKVRDFQRVGVRVFDPFA